MSNTDRKIYSYSFNIGKYQGKTLLVAVRYLNDGSPDISIGWMATHIYGKMDKYDRDRSTSWCTPPNDIVKCLTTWSKSPFVSTMSPIDFVCKTLNIKKHWKEW
jgi:hypothetical protein